MSDPMDIEALVDRAKTGERSAFDELVGVYAASLRARVERWGQLRIGPKLDVDDVLQETFVRALQAIDGFQWQGEGSFFRWLCGVAKIAVADSARRRGREAGRQVEGVRVSGFPARGPTQSQALRREERFDRLQAALERLSPDYRQVLKLSRLEGRTVKEIAAAMGRTPSAVKHLIARGLRELKRIFGETGSIHLPDRVMKPPEEPDEGQL